MIVGGTCSVVFMVSNWSCQRNLAKEGNKVSWSKIVEIYCGQYSVHLDPCMACQELQYYHSGSVQGLLDGMCDYQCKAPRKYN